METSGNTVVITGGTSGIGLAFAEEFHKMGNTVIICGRREDRLKEISKRLKGIVVKNCDVSLKEEREAFANWAITNYPDTNILINNAGVQLASGFLQGVDMAKVETEIATNLIAPIHLSSLFIKHLVQKPNPVIINISSGLAFVPLAFMPIYCATKAAVHSFTLSLRFQLKNTPIKVFEIAPPAVDTELGHDRRTNNTQSHGGISVGEFMMETMEAIKNDVYEACIGSAKNLREKNEQMFLTLNQR
jgi:uncharacterized oxidoreductase